MELYIVAVVPFQSRTGTLVAIVAQSRDEARRDGIAEAKYLRPELNHDPFFDLVVHISRSQLRSIIRLLGGL